MLDDQARDPNSPKVLAAAAYCVHEIAAAVGSIHRAHPTTRILLVGTDNGANDPTAFERYGSAAAMANIYTAFATLNTQLRNFALSDKRIAFFDIGNGFEGVWGTRGPDGTMPFKTVKIGKLEVANTVGNEPNNAELADHHSGLVWNTLLAQSFVTRLREAFKMPITPISDGEVTRFVAAP